MFKLSNISTKDMAQVDTVPFVLRTWQATSMKNDGLLYWLSEDISDIAVWTVGYNASISRWRGTAMHLTDRATNILNTFLTEKKLQHGEIILIGHSLGGLIIKQLLLTANSMASSRNEVRSFLERIQRIGFLATPHFGSGHASLVSRFVIQMGIHPLGKRKCPGYYTIKKNL